VIAQASIGYDNNNNSKAVIATAHKNNGIRSGFIFIVVEMKFILHLQCMILQLSVGKRQLNLQRLQNELILLLKEDRLFIPYWHLFSLFF
jgi:hypothetical protein